MRPEIQQKTAAIGSSIILDVNWELPSCYVAIKYFDADPTAGPANEVTPALGTILVQARLINHGKLVSITDGLFDCTAVNSFASFVGNASSVEAVPSGVTVATHYTLVVSQNAS